MSFGEAVRSVLNQYAGFSGRARRREYWYWFVVIALANIVISIVWAMSDNVGMILAAVVGLAVLLPSLAVAIRRLHDTGRSGWWFLIGLVPFVGPLVLLVFYLLDGDPNTNQYGASPKATAPA